jgi:DNA helicase-2/ATP-dependent DNA helicase PcrA
MGITIEHIKEAESFLLNGKTFEDIERIPFIKNLESCDLLAVPGSGKTTALIAKLYCLSKQLPFDDGSGILVLAHTNAAVDEIELKLKKHCPSLFDYPNFVGTIQSFVNKFLANPANMNKYDSYIIKNDNDIYKKEVENFYYSLEWRKKDQEQKLKNLLYGKANYGRNNISTKEKNINTINYIYYLKLDFINRKILSGDDNSTLYKLGGNANNYYLEIEQWKEELLKKGFLSYIVSFFLANWYLHNFPEVKEQLQNRFKYVFIDEMQDLERYQIDLIDKIFHEEESKTIIQRIGDINQAIYSSGHKVKIECDWVSRNERYITGSNRLTKINAELVNKFTLDDKNGQFIVVGNNVLENDEIKPHLVLFDNDSKGKLKDKFEEIIKKYDLHNLPTITDKKAEKKNFKIIGWTGERENEGDGKLCLHTIFGYKKETKSNKEDYDSLSKYIQLFNHETKTLEAVRKSILNALVTILRHEGETVIRKVRDKEVERYYSKIEMIDFVKDYQKDTDYLLAYECFKDILFRWSFDLTTKYDYEGVYNSIVEFIKTDFKEWFSLALTNNTTQLFIGDKFVSIKIEKKEKDDEDKLNIDIATVHSVKGQTHCATMYVETSYHEYETKKLTETKTTKKIVSSKPNPLFNTEKHNFTKPRSKEALKMMYVGFSRPTHLLCFAVLLENVHADLDEFEKAGWEIETVL